MSREWKPGDVASVTFDNASSKYGPANVISRISVRSPGWWAMGQGRGLTDSQVAELNAQIRPLVVIDAEDREQVERLLRELFDRAGWGRYMPEEQVAMQAALRSLVTPPKPDEPLCLGAVVEDEQGNRWIRHGAGAMPWMLAGASPSNRDTYAYATLPAVRVLSEGVTS